jgi:hypothetical protein
MKNIESYIAEDKVGHLERSYQPLLEHADHSNELTAAQRSAYFEGITTAFPLMFLGHYYDWVTEGSGKNYMEEFFPAYLESHMPENKALLNAIYANPADQTVWAGAIAAYLSSYPYELLVDFAQWGFSPEQGKAAAEFVIQDRSQQLPQLVERLAQADTNEKRKETVAWLGTEFPYALLTRLHHCMFDD